jgi:hypothetical protein
MGIVAHPAAGGAYHLRAEQSRGGNARLDERHPGTRVHGPDL